jgi:UDP-2-acetamido-3-amino-2,3-dideoxy-glucuronate N-acetyltransferase
MNIGLIGLGYWGKNLYRNLLISEDVKEIFILDVKNQNFKIKNKKLYFLKSNDFFKNSDIDSFIISTPTSTHYKYISKDRLNIRLVSLF